MKIAILGSAPSSRLLAPFNDHTWEIWACSPPNYDLPRVDAWFELHSLKRKLLKENEPYTKVLKAHPRAYINKQDPLAPNLPNSIAFPFDEMIAEYGGDFFTSSVAWMFAFALKQKPSKIGLWGVDMSAGNEYDYQRPGVKFFVREAEKQNVDVYAPPESDVLMPMPLYALREQSPVYWKLRTRKLELQQRVAECAQKRQKAEHEEIVLQGALDDLRYVEKTYCPARFKL